MVRDTQSGFRNRESLLKRGTTVFVFLLFFLVGYCPCDAFGAEELEQAFLVHSEKLDFTPTGAVYLIPTQRGLRVFSGKIVSSLPSLSDDESSGAGGEFVAAVSIPREILQLGQQISLMYYDESAHLHASSIKIESEEELSLFTMDLDSLRVTIDQIDSSQAETASSLVIAERENSLLRKDLTAISQTSSTRELAGDIPRLTQQIAQSEGYVKRLEEFVAQVRNQSQPLNSRTREIELSQQLRILAEKVSSPDGDAHREIELERSHHEQQASRLIEQTRFEDVVILRQELEFLMQERARLENEVKAKDPTEDYQANRPF